MCVKVNQKVNQKDKSLVCVTGEILDDVLHFTDYIVTGLYYTE